MNSEFFERYHAEAGDVLNAILTHSHDCVKLLTIDGEIEYASTSAVGALGLSNSQEAVGKDWRSYWPAEEQPRLSAAIALAAKGSGTRFEGFTRSAEGAIRHWKVAICPVGPGAGSVTHLLAVSTDITAQVAEAARDRARLEKAEEQLVQRGHVERELRHRLKNQLAVIGAVAKLLARHTADAKEMAGKLEDKLVALARAQDLLTILREEPIGAREAVQQVLRASAAGERIEMAQMPDAKLPDESVQQLALILGELQTNALKHGALRRDAGSVRLSGQMQGAVLTLAWEENCGHPIAPTHIGAGGFKLIERLGSASGNSSTIAWEMNGIRVRFHVRTIAPPSTSGSDATRLRP